MQKKLEGLPVSLNIKENLKTRIKKLKNKKIVPTLAAILIGDDPASKIYVNTKQKVFIKNNCKSFIHKFNKNIDENKLIEFIDSLNENNLIHGILVQLPLPKHLNENKILDTIFPDKDVDGFHPVNVGKLSLGNPRFIPCTPNACLEILKFYNIKVSSKHVVILGRSNIVGKPLMSLLAQKFEVGNATVTICHTGTKNISYFTKQADILIVAIGKPNFINEKMIKKGVHILDVGINRISDDSERGYKIVGDVDYNGVANLVSSITPVPGGIGPMTITMLLKNTIQAAEHSIK